METKKCKCCLEIKPLSDFYKSGNTFQRDNGFDSEAFDFDSSDIYFKFEGNRENLIIAGIQEITDDLEFPLTVKIGATGTYNFTVDSKKNIHRTVYLHDKVTDIKYDLKNLVSLSLSPGTYYDRFYISFSPKTLSTDDLVLEKNISVYYHKETKEIRIENKSNSEIKAVELFNVIGQQVKKWTNFTQSSRKKNLSVHTFSNAVYIVKINTEKGLISKKIIIN